MLTVIPGLISAVLAAPEPPARLGHDAAVYAVAFSPDGRSLLTASDDGLVRVWDTQTRKEKRRFKAHEGGALALSLSSGGRTLATGGRDKTVRVWDLKTGKETAALTGLIGDVESLALTPDGRTVVASSSGRTKTFRVSDHIPSFT
jgi:WD40 repeat protein